jgi:rare lipoprotein A
MARLGLNLPSATAGCLILFLAAAPRLVLAEPTGDADSSSQNTGIASWYGPDFQGRLTADGEVYDKEKLTAAHRTLPFGTYLLVQNLDNGSSVVVRVNDRGPFARNRLIDLSEEAARIIGMIPTGTAMVSIEVIPREEALAWKGGPLAGAAGPVPEANPSGVETSSSKLVDDSLGARVRIQVASYASEANAKATIQRLAKSGLNASLELVEGHFRVVFPDLSPDEARLVTQRLEGLEYRGFTVIIIRPAP